MRPLFASLFLLASCSDDAAAPADAGRLPDGAMPVDAGDRDAGDPSVDAGADADTSGCTQAMLGELTLDFGDDVSIHYRAGLTPIVPDTGSRIEIFFERYVPGPDVGTFELGGDGPDGNFGTCRHCVVIPTLVGERVYYADRGTLELTADPYKRRLRGRLVNARFVESMVNGETRESTPIEGGRCIELADAQFDAAFPLDGWTCDEDQFADTEACDCECGSWDPDCERFFCAPGDPECPEPLPLADCGEGDICGTLLASLGSGPIGGDPLPTRCFETCDWGTTACATGACLYDTGQYGADVCAIGEDEVSGAAVGDECPPRPFMRPCGVVGGFAQGYCDLASICRPLCERDRDCPAGTMCQPLFIDGTRGYCTVPETPE
jgi:hypothetical protein